MPDSVTRLMPGQAAVFAQLQGGDGVIVDTNTTFYYGLNRTAAFLWQTLQAGPRLSRDQLVDSLCRRFEVSVEVARADVDRFLGQLERYGLVERSA
jgi:PqqD family protein of HPr-rel-A system